MFNATELVSIRKYCGYGARTAIMFNAQGGLGTLDVLLAGLTPEEEEEARGYLSKIATLEQALIDMSDNLDTAAAAIWTHNQNEMGDRRSLYNAWRLDLCGFLGIPAGPSLSGGGSGACGGGTRVIRG